ncbi:MAG: alpha/beta hydrolase [Flavobacteriales bacterium]|nr:alpha/beta hydrolase [Flavobacteriales bacterium]
MLTVDFRIIEGKRLRYCFLESKEKPVIVLLHGYPDNLQVFYKLAPMLADNFSVFTFDWPGMGESEPWSGGATPLISAKRLKKIIDAFGFEHVHILAHDMGGQVALVFASQYSKNVHSITVLNSLLMWDQDTSWEIKLLRKFGFNSWALKNLPRIIFWRAINTFLNNTRSLDEKVKDELWKSFRNKEVRDYIVRMCAGYEAQLKSLPKYYSNIECPVSLIWSGKGKHFDIQHAHEFKKYCNQTRITEITEAYHWMVVEFPEDILRAMSLN